jgi:hypothetical protein
MTESEKKEYVDTLDAFLEQLERSDCVNIFLEAVTGLEATLDLSSYTLEVAPQPEINDACERITLLQDKKRCFSFETTSIGRISKKREKTTEGYDYNAYTILFVASPKQHAVAKFSFIPVVEKITIVMPEDVTE